MSGRAQDLADMTLRLFKFLSKIFLIEVFPLVRGPVRVHLHRPVLVGTSIFFTGPASNQFFFPASSRFSSDLGGEKVVLAGLGKLTSRPDFFIITGIFSISIFALSCMYIYWLLDMIGLFVLLMF